MSRRGQGFELMTDGTAVVSTATATHSRRPLLFLIGAVTLPVIALDQIVKLIVKSHMALYESIPIVRNYLDLTYTQNPGAAFSMLADAAPVFREGFLFALAGAAIVVLAVMLVRAERVSINSIALALILAGATGNLIDRAVRGEVIDFIRVHYYDLNYPIFNVADSAITIGVALIIIASFFTSDTETPPTPST
jgi:signal peptidase II